VKTPAKRVKRPKQPEPKTFTVTGPLAFTLEDYDEAIEGITFHMNLWMQSDIAKEAKPYLYAHLTGELARVQCLRWLHLEEMVDVLAT
jgi:hypothetical protein